VTVHSTLWNPITLGPLTLPHRLAMSPMTRNRALPDGTPTTLDANYFGQHASFGLLFAGGTQPSAVGQGFLHTHGLYTDHHIHGWRRVADAVHHRNGYLFIQLMHAGRIAHPDNTPHHLQPVAPSALIACGVSIHTAAGSQPVPAPRALSTSEVRNTVDDFRRSAAAAVTAGADGVEIHAANGFLVHQFLSANSNHRTDRYGGSVANRIRFAVEIASAIAEEIGAERTGIRISPGLTAFGIDEGGSGPDTYRALLAELAAVRLAFVQVTDTGHPEYLDLIRHRWPGVLIVTRPGLSPDRLESDLRSGLADVVSVGRLALANPDLPERLRRGIALNRPDPTTFYGGDEHGYTDYPSLDLPGDHCNSTGQTR
jgi:N-ethylmaleimide reductase